MKVILKENVKSLGNVGDVVKVSPGFARNFLMPRNLAIVAVGGESKSIESYKKALGKKILAEKNAATELQKKLNDFSLTLIKKVGANGKLFGSVTNVELAAELEKKGFVVDRRQITLDKPIKSLGQFECKIKLFTDVEAKFPIKIEIDAVQAEELKKMQKEASERKKKEKKEAAEELAKKAAEEKESNEEA
jgi:large subunit ribosomal protein L9